MVGATQPAGREHLVDARTASFAGAGYRVAYVALAAAVVVATAFAPVNSGAVALAHFLGGHILGDRAIPMRLGSETFTASGSYAGGIGWLGAVANELLVRAGHGYALFATMLAALVAFAFVELRARRQGGRLLALGAVVLAGSCAPGSLGIAGGITTAAFAAVLTYVLERPSRTATIVATLLAVVWCNVAAEGLLAPAIAACIAAATTLRGGTQDERRWSRFACLGTALALLATPALLSYPLYALGTLRLDRDLFGVVAYHPIDVAPLAYRVGFTAMILAGLAFGLQRDRGASIPLFAAAAVLALMNGAFVIVFGVLAAPVLAASAAAAYPRFAHARAGSARADIASGVIAVALAAGLVPVVGVPATAPGYALAASLASDGRPHRVFCYDVDWCDVAISGAPLARVFADGRVAAYPSTVLGRQRDVVAMKNHWRSTIDKNKVDTMILRNDRPLTTMISMAPGWHLVASDAAASVFERAALR
jgi:hypothetical protein